MSWTGDVEVCNAALSLLGAERITALSDTSKQAILCNLFYSQCRDTVLRSYPWNFAVRRRNLGASLASSDPNAPVWGFAYGFTLPTSPYCLRVLEIEEDTLYKIEGRFLYADSSSINARYISRVTAASEFDDAFKVALAANLAMNLAMPITKSKPMLDAMSALYAFQLDAAEHADTQEGSPDEIDSDEMLNVRQGAFISRSQYLAR